MLLICDKTGRYWPVQSVEAGRRAALALGLKNYTIEERR